MKKTYIFLTGGLGNQLFQLAAALSLGRKTEIVLDVSSGNPRNGSHEIADMFSIFSGAEVSTEKKKKNTLSTKIGGYVLRSASEPRGIEKKKFYQIAVQLVASIYFSILHIEFIVVKANVGVGYSQVKISSRLNTFLVGYFQSFRWADCDFVREFMGLIQVQNPSSKFNALLAEMRTVQPVIMHIRRGDYAFEPNFGVLSQSYYENGLEHLRKSEIKQEVWVFTDDPDWARSITRSEKWTDEKIKLVDDSELSTGEVFDLMRSGSGYVIANSSFSWWAAYLSRVDGACVVAPQPWFVGLPEPNSLIPVSWKRLSGFEPKS